MCLDLEKALVSQQTQPSFLHPRYPTARTCAGKVLGPAIHYKQTPPPPPTPALLVGVQAVCFRQTWVTSPPLPCLAGQSPFCGCCDWNVWWNCYVLDFQTSLIFCKIMMERVEVALHLYHVADHRTHQILLWQLLHAPTHLPSSPHPPASRHSLENNVCISRWSGMKMISLSSELN